MATYGAGITWQQRTHTLMNNFRVAVLATIAFLALLMVIVALVAAVYDVSDRGLGVIGIVLTALTSLVGSVIVYLKIDSVEVKADEAAVKAATAARKSEEIHHDILNGPMRRNLKQAVLEIEEDPAIQERRIERVAKGVQKDRHDLRNREAGPDARAQMEERVRRRLAGESPRE